ncbi:unnamed protein product, partial [Mycena citricolor]
AGPIIDQFFCPDSFSFASSATGDVTVLAYSTILSLPLAEYSIGLLSRLSERYPVDRLHSAVFSHSRAEDKVKRAARWEDCVRSIVSVPVRVANALEGKDIPPQLEHGVYFNQLCERCEIAIAAMSSDTREDESGGLTFLLAKLINLGCFPSSPPSSRSQPSFFQATLPLIRERLAVENLRYSGAWRKIFRGFASTLALQSVFVSLLSALPADGRLDGSPQVRSSIKREGLFLNSFLGSLDVEEDWQLWEALSAVVLTREWNEAHARIFVCWISGPRCNAGALETLLDRILDLGSNPEHIKHSLLNRHRYVTAIFLLTLSYLPPSSSKLQSLALSPALISSIGQYISHLDDSVRRCGMLAAEFVAQRSGKTLDFKDWDGDSDGKVWARSLRALLAIKDVDAEVLEEPPSLPIPEAVADDLPPLGHHRENPIEVGYDSDDDSLSGYISESSSRSVSPTRSELAEIEQDPTLSVGRKKVPRPVYLAQLGALIRPPGSVQVDESKQADELEVGLSCAEELIRKKTGYGVELEENAVNLVYGLVGLQDNYELEGFSEKRQGALNALVACIPRVAATCIIEEFFKNQYSIDQRYVMLNALALGARELASLSIPSSAVPRHRIAFPSKTLPSLLHQKYVENGNQLLPRLVEDISQEALDRDARDNVDKVPQLVRERRLRVQKQPLVKEVEPDRPLQKTSFTQVAAECFIAPLINRFWLFFRDEQSREERTALRLGRQRYQSTGTGLILNPMVLSHLLITLAVLVHASKNAPEWLAVIAPEALELAVTLGTRPMSLGDDDNDGNSGGKEAAVVSSALELSLIVLDGCLEVDDGRSLGLDNTTLLLATGEWASSVFSSIERGAKLPGEGGIQEIKLKRAAAGVLLKVDTLTSKWRRSMIDTA